MIAGFTGPRSGMTASQKARLPNLLESYGVRELHLGDAIGADAEAHLIAVGLGIHTVGHPPVVSRWRAFCHYDEEREPRPFLDRNRDIVDESEMLFATPASRTEQWRGSGTWHAIRYARKIGRHTVMVWPTEEELRHGRQ